MQQTGKALIFALLLGAGGRSRAAAQAPVYRAGWGSVAALAGAGILAVAPQLAGLPRGAVPCVPLPCNPADLPGIDRWVVGHQSRSAANASDVLLVGVAGGGLLAAVGGMSPARARGDASVLLNAVAWTEAGTQWIKVLVHRSRPVLYTSNALGAAGDRDSRESFPSGHASAAFAVATAYAVLAARQHLPHAGRNTIALYAGAAGVGALRVAAGRHFPTDVLAGAALGTGIGWLTARFHPRAP